VVTAALVALAAYGWHGARPLGRPARGLLVLGVAGLVLAAAGSLPGGRQLLEFLVAELPGAGLLRDGQKWVAWWALPLAVGAGLGLRRLAARARRFGRAPAAAVTAAVVLVPLVALPDLAWGAAGRLEPVRYPAAWQQVRDRLAAGGGPGDVLVLPFGAYRAFSWNDERPSLDPAPRWLPVPAVVDDELVVGGTPVAGEDRRAREVAAAVADPARLAELGIGWVLVEERTAGRPVPAAVRALPEEISGPELTLYRVPDARSGPAPSTGRVIAVGGAHVVALGLVGAAVLWIIAGASTVPLRRRTPKKVGT
jgi:hypothetical protein